MQFLIDLFPWFQAAIQAVSLLLVSYLVFFKTYFQEKGKNLATKEDIEEITSVVESVKSQLEFSLQARLSLRAEEHQALVDCFTKYGAWLSAIRNCSFVGIDYESIGRLAELRSHMDRLGEDADLAAERMELFVENPDLVQQRGILGIKTLDFQGHVHQATFTFAQHYIRVQQMRLKTPVAEQIQPYKVLLDTEKELYKNYKEMQRGMYLAIGPLLQQFRVAVSAHIRALASGSKGE